MKQFLKTILMFSIPIVLITIVFEIFLRTMHTGYGEKLSEIKANYKDIEVLAVGNSHAVNGIDPRVFDLVTYNMAFGNQSLYFDKRITLKHIDSLKNLKYVLISIDQHSLYFSSQGIRDTWLYYDYDIKYKNNKVFFNNLSYFWFGYTPKISISIVKDKVLKFVNGKSMNDEMVKGFMPNYGTEYNYFREEAIKNKASYYNREVRKSNERNEIISDLDDFIIKLKNRNITPIIITLPMYYKLNNYLDKKYVEQNKKDISTITKKHQLCYWDFSQEGTDINFFYNSDHLNSKGANIFSKKINDKLFSFLSSNK